MNYIQLLAAFRDHLQTGPGYALTVDISEQKMGRYQLNLYHYSWLATTPLISLLPNFLLFSATRYQYEDPELLPKLQARMDKLTKREV